MNKDHISDNEIFHLIAAAITTYDNGGPENCGAEDPDVYREKWNGWVDNNLPVAIVVFGAIAPALIERGRQAGLEEAAQVTHECFLPRCCGQDPCCGDPEWVSMDLHEIAAHIRARKEKNNV